MASTTIQQEIWDSNLARRLDKPQTWNEVYDTLYTDAAVIVMPYEAAGNEATAGTAFHANAAARNTLSNVIIPGVVTQATETLSIVLSEYVSEYVDFADQVQSNYVKDAAIGTKLGKLVGERIEALMLADHGSWTDFGDTGGGVLGAASTAFTVTENNIDDVILGIKERVNANNGANIAKEKGLFCVWRAADWTKLEKFMMANGFSMADYFLKNGADTAGVFYDGMWHYMSTGHTANHLFGGVRKVAKIGLRTSGPASYGKVRKVDDPASSTAGHLPGSNFYSYFDYGLKVPTNLKVCVYDLNVN